MLVVLLLLLLLLPIQAAPAAQDEWNGVERVVVIGDVHGDLDQFVAILRLAGVIDRKGRWSAGKTHLVQLGDVVDRGAESRKVMDLLMKRKVMDLLMKLEKQARRAGGYVHALIGNHEAMNIYTDLRYVSAGEYEAFRDQDSERVRDFFYQQHVKEVQRNSSSDGVPKFDEAYREQWKSKHPLGYFEHRYHFGPNGKYGKWILGHNAVVKINDTIFLHGGISPKYSSYTIRQINDQVREELKDFAKLEGGIVTDEEGPLWYRGLALDDQAALDPQLTEILEAYGARRIVVGHTEAPGRVVSRFGGRVLIASVGLSKSYGSHTACLEIEKGTPHARGADGRLRPVRAASETLRPLQDTDQGHGADYRQPSPVK
jgi:hypothetical protein